MISKILCGFLFILSTGVYGQVVTGSFDPSVVCVNPAASKYRLHSFASLILSLDTTKKNMDVSSSGGVKNEKDISIKNSIFSGGLIGKKYSGEIFYTLQQAEKTTDIIDNSDSVNAQHDSNQLQNNQLNFAVHVNTKLTIGVKFLNPRAKVTSTSNYTSSGFISNGTSSQNINFLGIGLGATWEIGRLAIGAEYTPISFDSTYNYTSTYRTTASASTATYASSGSNKSKLIKKSLGLAYIFGNSKNRALRFELSRQWTGPLLSSQGSETVKDAERTTFTIEATMAKLYGTFSMIKTTGDYTDFQNLLYYLVLPEAISTAEQTTYAWSAGFMSAKGHSIGGIVKWSNRSAYEAAYFGGPATNLTYTKQTILGITYSYFF